MDKYSNSDAITETSKANLRREAEKVANENELKTFESLSINEVQQLFHELRVHQIELEMQNEELHVIQTALEAERVRYCNLYDLAPVGYCTVDENGVVFQANFTASILLETTRDELVNHSFSAFILKEDQDIYYLFQKGMIESHKKKSCDLRMVKNDGTPFWAHVTAILETEADHTELRIIFYDMTKRKEVEIALQEEKRRYQLLADYAKECIFLMDASGNYIYISPACETTSGYKSEEFLADRFLMTNIIHPDDREMYQHHLDHLHENDIKEMELRIVGRDGSEHWIAHYCDTVRDENGLYLGRRGSNRDITERKEREFGLKMFRTLLDHSSDSIEVVDPLTMRFLMINDTACRRLGYSREELLSTAILTETIHPPSKR